MSTSTVDVAGGTRHRLVVYDTRFWSSENRTEGRREQQLRENSGERVLAGRLEKRIKDRKRRNL